MTFNNTASIETKCFFCEVFFKKRIKRRTNRKVIGGKEKSVLPMNRHFCSKQCSQKYSEIYKLGYRKGMIYQKSLIKKP